ncbi:hypothetical protein Bsph_3126 [Lysinibacillus sphaericus C3-41]|uniref:Uncharacterized protein n=1 Tax=Lysinibacillus sphaericus (strain C3-41) TaxID=444177 RepID=B1HPZ6_LYSSC|nr:hypothetical protein Bsph_3126 [Lysinibacillus sphaericus C3-41]
MFIKNAQAQIYEYLGFDNDDFQSCQLPFLIIFKIFQMDVLIIFHFLPTTNSIQNQHKNYK